MKKEISKPLVIFAFSMVVLAGLVVFSFLTHETELLTLEKLNTLISSKQIEKIEVGEDHVTIVAHNGEHILPKDAVDLKTLYSVAPVEVSHSTSWDEIVFELILIGAVCFSIVIMLRMSRSKGTQGGNGVLDNSDPLGVSMTIAPTTATVTFADVAGIEEVKEELFDIIDFLSNPSKYTKFGVRVPKGVILAGPPGVGKTMIAKAVAGEAKVPFFYQSGSSFVQIFVGVGHKLVRELFAQAKKHYPAIIFIDEIDAVGKARGANRSDEREATLNQLLTEMDGFEENTGVIVIAATNKIEMLDEALLRAGRFDRRVFVSLPDIEERKKIAELYLKKIPHNVDIQAVGAMSIGFSAAGMENLVNEAALFALKNNKQIVTTDDLMAVRDRVLIGSHKVHTFDEEEREILSRYMAARAYIAMMVDPTFEKMSLVGNSDPKMDGILSKTELTGRVKTYLGGIAGCLGIDGELYSIGEEDLRKAKELTHLMVERFGMGSDVGDRDFEGLFASIFGETQQMLQGKEAIIEGIATFLKTKEVITSAEVRQVMRDVL
jgi:ATP-dependent metalloprotease FtsH